MARHRKPENAALPRNLTRDGAGFRYRDPTTGARVYLRGPELSAVAEAHRRNALLGIGRPDSLAQVIQQYPVTGSPSTRSEKARILQIYVERWGAFPVRSITRRALSEAWRTLSGPHAVQKHRTLWIDLLRHAIAWGLCDVNEAERTLLPSLPKRGRQRHTDAGIAAIRAGAPDWLQIAVDLAIYSLQRRSDLIAATRTDVADGRWRVTQRKTGVRLEIEPGPTLAAVLERARVAQPIGATLVRVGGRPITGSGLSHAFARVRDQVAYGDLDVAERPSWHDLRAYGTWLYERAGYPVEYVQALAGHATARMTAHYQEGHEVRWQRVEAGL